MFWPEGIFWGGGGVYFETPAAGFYTPPPSFIPLGTKLLHTVFLFGGITFGNYCRKHDSILFLGESITVMQ